MDRRKFIRIGMFTAMAARIGMQDLLADSMTETPKWNKGLAKKGFDGPVTSEIGTASASDLTVRFLGTGASGWTDPDCGRRRHSSVLLDGKVLIDFTFSAEPMVPKGCHPRIIFYTHSHSDHFDPSAALRAGVRKVYVSDTWVERARRSYSEASEATGIPMPEFVPMALGEKVQVEGLCLTSMPANHPTSDLKEQAVIYMVEKGTTDERLGVRLLYATDTGGILGSAARIGGFDPLSKTFRPITAFIMEGTIPPNQEEDYRIFSHTTIEDVGRIANTMLQKGRYLPPEGQPAYLTHMSTKNFPPHDELNRIIPWPLRASYDGQEVIFRAVA